MKKEKHYTKPSTSNCVCVCGCVCETVERYMTAQTAAD